MTVKVCTKCGYTGMSVTVTATCNKCQASFTLCNSCKLGWKIRNCPSCGTYDAKWRYLDTTGTGQVTEDMLSYLDNVGLSPKTYVAAWNAAKGDRLAQREKDGDAAHRGIDLPPVEVEFLRKMEDFMFEPIFTVADDRASYVVVEDGHVVKMRFFNADIRNNMPDTISQFIRLREFWYEKQRNEKGSLSAFPATFGDLSALETLVLRGSYAPFQETFTFPNLKKLAAPGLEKLAPVFNFTTLEELSLAGCTFNDETLEKLGLLTNLKKLQLAYIGIRGGVFDKIPESLKQLSLLEELDVKGCTIGKFKMNPWPAWLAELPNLKLVHRNPDTLWGWGEIETVLHQRDPEAHRGNILDPEMASRKMNLTDITNWWKENNSEILAIGWTGIASNVV